jgi:hypothetical protein
MSLAALAIAAARDYPGVTDTLNQDIGTASETETEAERQARLAWEAEMIAEARDDVVAGRLVDAAEVRAWVDSLSHIDPAHRGAHALWRDVDVATGRGLHGGDQGLAGPVTLEAMKVLR